ncbi:MAG TPA: cytochrome c, partial [Gammaproteobacteria bacterium]|nr:cytochrome c [Gammaproteobacteria bacterium]
MRIESTLLLALVASSLLALSAPVLAADEEAPAPDASSAVARGHYVLYASGCIACHTAEGDKAKPLAGGRALKTGFGTFYPPNITPDKETGIGGWTEAQFAEAVTHGVSPQGKPLYPALPYTTYAGMRKQDVQDLYAYLQTVTPVHNQAPPHDLKFPYNFRSGLWIWRKLYFHPEPFKSNPQKSEQWNRGAYLVTTETHCGECHTPRNFMGAMEQDKQLTGGVGPEGHKIPNITQDKDKGIGSW